MDTQQNIIYKYRAFDKEEHSLDILRNGELWFAFPKTLNDPFDCKIEFDLTSTMDTYASIWRKISNSRSIIEQKPSCIDSLIEMFYPEIPFRVLSLTKNPLNFLMWSHYADSHKGFCIGLKTYKDMDANSIKIESGQVIEKNKYDIINLLPLIPVIYSDDMPSPIDAFKTATDEESIRFLTQKSTLWKYEEEQRCILDNNVLLKPGTPIKISKDDIAEIIFGLNIKNEDKEKIINIVSNYEIKPKIYQCKYVKGKYELKREEINY